MSYIVDTLLAVVVAKSTLAANVLLQGSAQNCLSGGYPGAELLARMHNINALMQHSNTLLSYEWW